MHGVVEAEEVALAVAGGKEAGNGLVVIGADLGVVVDVDAIGHSQVGCKDRDGVEGGLADRREPIVHNAELRVLALVGHAVVALHGSGEVVGRHAEQLRQLLKRVGLENLTVSHALLELAGDVLQHGLVALGELLGHVLGVVGVEDGPGDVALGVHAGVGDVRLEGHLIHETVAVGVHREHREEERRALVAAGLNRELVNHGSGRALGDAAADPLGHEDGIAGVGALGHVGALVGVVLDRSPAVDHLLVAGDVAGSQHDALLCVELNVLAVGVGGDDARHALGRAAHELLGMGVEEVLATVVGGRLDEHVAQVLVRLLAVGTVEHAPLVAGVAHGILEHDVALGHLVPTGLGGAAGRGLHGHAVGGTQLSDVVDDTGGLCGPGANEVVVGRLLTGLIHEAGSLVGIDLEAVVLEDLGADGAHVKAAEAPTLAALHDDDACTVAGGRLSGTHAGHATADNDDIVLVGLGNVGDGVGCDLPGVQGHPSRRGGLVGQRDRRGNRGGAQGGPRCGCAYKGPSRDGGHTVSPSAWGPLLQALMTDVRHALVGMC